MLYCSGVSWAAHSASLWTTLATSTGPTSRPWRLKTFTCMFAPDSNHFQNRTTSPKRKRGRSSLALRAGVLDCILPLLHPVALDKRRIDAPLDEGGMVEDLAMDR